MGLNAGARGPVTRVLLGCAVACCAGTVVVAFGAPGWAGAAATIALVVATLLTARSTEASDGSQPWRPVRLVTRAALFAAAATSGAALVAFAVSGPAGVDSPVASPDHEGIDGLVPPESAPPSKVTLTPMDPKRSAQARSDRGPEPAEPSASAPPTSAPVSPVSPVSDDGPAATPSADAPTRDPQPAPQPKPPSGPSPTPDQPSPSPTPDDDDNLVEDLIGPLFPSPRP